jgi:hypothetical protein
MDLEKIWQTPRSKRVPTILEGLLDNKGGTYRSSGNNSVFFHMYTNIQFSPAKAERKNFTIGLIADTPPGIARDPSSGKRSEYWQHSKKLQNSSLVALMIVSPNRSKIFLGTISSMDGDIANSAKNNAKKIQFRVSFFDAEVELYAIRRENISVNRSKFAILIDSNVMFESIRPFLETLQKAEPTTIPFSRYITPENTLEGLPILIPRYATVPGFRFNLNCMARRDFQIQSLQAENEESVTRARLELNRASELDPSQVDSVIDALTREISLIQG